MRLNLSLRENSELKLITSLFLAFFLLSLALIPVSAAGTDSVSATVTVQNVSVAVSDGTVTYGTLATSTTEDTTSGGLNDSQTAQNDGNVTIDLNIRGQDSANWTLAGTAGSDQYRHRFCTSNCDASPTWTALTTNYQNLAQDVASSGTQVFDLELSTPTSSSNFSQQSVDVTVQAVAAS
jgi:hypothetical protein